MPPPAGGPETLVDGFLPYLMDAARGEQSIAYLSPFGIGDQPSITIDLERVQQVDSIHLHTIDQSDTVPQGAPPGSGLPHALIIEGAQQADFSDAKELLSYQRQSIYDIAPIIMRDFEATPCRWIGNCFSCRSAQRRDLGCDREDHSGKLLESGQGIKMKLPTRAHRGSGVEPFLHERRQTSPLAGTQVSA